MAVARPKSGVTEYTATTGAGSLTLTGAAPGFRGFVSADDGLSYPYAIYQEGTAFETGIGLYTHASRQLARTTILANINSTTVPLNLGAGTKEVSIVIPGERVAMLDAPNLWSADQTLNSNRLYLDEGNSWIETSSDDVFRLFLNSVQAIDINYNGGLTYFQLMSTNEGGLEGPVVVLRRDTNTPAINDQIGSIYVQSRDSGGALQHMSRIRTFMAAVTAGTYASVMDFCIAANGALQTIMALRANTVSIASGVALLTAGKTTTSQTVAGTEMYANGGVQIVCVDGNTPLTVCRAAGDGTHIILTQNGVNCATVTTTGATTTWGSFTGNHLGLLRADVTPEHERLGTVLAMTGTILTDPAVTEPVYELIPAVDGDRCVLGVWGGRQRSNIMGGGDRDLIMLFALGNGQIRATGPVAAGDFLWASATPGVAERQPNQDQVGPWTVAKATNNSPEQASDRLVTCTYMAGG